MIFLAMILIVAGIFVLAVKIRLDLHREVPRGIGGLILAVGLVMLLLSCVRIIPAGHTGVQVLFGKVLETPLQSGLRLVNPLVQVENMSVRTEAYTMSSTAGEGLIHGDDSIKVLASDGLEISLDITLWYHLDPAEASRIYKEIGLNYEEKIVRTAIRTAVRNAAARHKATDIYATKREAFILDIETELTPVFLKYGVLYEKTNLRNVQLPPRLTSAIQEKLAADQEQQRMVFVLQKEQQEAERKKVEAIGISNANEIISNSLSTEYLQWYHIEMMRQLAESQNTTFIFSPLDTGLIPFLNVG